VVEWDVRGDGGRGVARSQTRGGGGGFTPKTRNRAAVARFRVCRVKRRWREVDVGGRVGRTRRLRSRGGAFANTRWGEGIRSKMIMVARWLGFAMYLGVNGWGGDLWHHRPSPWQSKGWEVESKPSMVE
jgi:hypothetical protein